MDNLEMLVDKARLHDRAAFTSLYEYVYKDLYKFAYYTLRSAEDAEDAVSETVVDAFETIHKLREASAFRAWIFRILSNKCKQKMRQYYKSCVPIDEGDCTYEHDLAQKQDLQKALANLNDDEKLIVSLSIFGGYKGDEIGRILGIKHSTIRSKYRRALEKMKKYIETEACI